MHSLYEALDYNKWSEYSSRGYREVVMKIENV